MIHALKKSSSNRKDPSRFEELDLRLFEIALVLLRLDHVAERMTALSFLL
jgi:hypothetical protein